MKGVVLVLDGCIDVYEVWFIEVFLGFKRKDYFKKKDFYMY